MREWLDRLTEALGFRPFEEWGWDVTFGALLGAALALVGTVVAGILIVEISRRASRRLNPEGAGPARGVVRTVHAAFLLLGLTFAVRVLGIDVATLLDAHLIQLGGTDVTVALVLAALGVVFVAHLLSLVVRRALRRAGDRHEPLARSSLAAVGRLVHYVIMAIGLVVAFETIGFDLNALLAVGGLLAVALGFAMQAVVTNFVSGVILLVERAIKPDDVLEVEGRVVRVQELGIRTTRVRTRDGEDMIVPNSVISQSVVKNHTHGDTLLRLKVPVGVVYSSDLDKVRSVLETAADALPARVRTRPVQVLLTGFGASSIDFEVQIWTSDPWTSRQLRSELHFAIWRALRDANVTIAFPQLDVHLDDPVVAALAGRA